MDVDEDITSSHIPKRSTATTVSKLTFTIDGIPPTKWLEKFQEFHAWLEIRRLSKNNHYTILKEFVSRFTRILKNW